MTRNSSVKLSPSTAGPIAAATTAVLFSSICAIVKAWSKSSATRIVPTSSKLPIKSVTNSLWRLKAWVRARPEGTRNENLISGGVEVLAQELKILNPSAPPPFLLDDENLSETTRLTYRVLDLRRLPMQRNMKLRYKAAMAFRRFLDKHGFIDIETPMLTKSTPEGAATIWFPLVFTTATSMLCRSLLSSSNRC